MIPNLPAKEDLQTRNWEAIGIVRSRKLIESHLMWLKQFYDEPVFGDSAQTIELKNMITLSKKIAGAALNRSESVGAHLWEEKQ